AQLINKSNQFNLTGTRYSEKEIKDLLECDEWIGRYFVLRDRFGDNGLISVVLLRKEVRDLYIDSWVMSCRVLGRGMEEFIVNDLMTIGSALGSRSLIGRYVTSGRNGLVSDLYGRMRFELLDRDGPVATWQRCLHEVTPLATHIAYVAGNGRPA